MTPRQLGDLIDRLGPALVLYACQWAAAPEDVVQDAFLKLVEARRAAGRPGRPGCSPSSATGPWTWPRRTGGGPGGSRPPDHGALVRRAGDRRARRRPGGRRPGATAGRAAGDDRGPPVGRADVRADRGRVRLLGVQRVPPVRGRDRGPERNPWCPMPDRPDPVTDRLSRFTPHAPGLDRDAILFAAGRRSARGSWVWKAAAGLLALSQAVTLVGLGRGRRPRTRSPPAARRPSSARCPTRRPRPCRRRRTSGQPVRRPTYSSGRHRSAHHRSVRPVRPAADGLVRTPV